MTVTCTNHFVSKRAADRYYQQYGYENADGQIAEGSIKIGPPLTKNGEKYSTIPGEGRYQIYTDEVLVAAAINLDQQVSMLVADGNKVLLPKQHLANYADIKRMLETGGGRYDAKGFFVFPDGIDPAAVLAGMTEGKVLNGKKDSQSFFTPQDLGYQVCRAAGNLEGKRVLEPSAGDGALADIAEAAGAEVVVVENYKPNILRLREKGYDVIDRDFLTVTPDDIGLFDVIVANPPFSKNQDIDHITHMWSFLKPEGVLSVISSQSWLKGSQRKQKAFKEFLERHNAEIEEIEAGVFKESGTTVGTLHIRVTKPVRVEEVIRQQPVLHRSPAQNQLAMLF